MVLERFDYLRSDSERKLLIGQFHLTLLPFAFNHEEYIFFAHVYFSNEAWCHASSGVWKH